MFAVDTNIVIRWIVDDDSPDQARAARTLLCESQIWISKTVILETMWVLQRFLPVAEIRPKMAVVLGLENVVIEDSEAVMRAFALMETGLDPADAMHLASAPPFTNFITFDRDLVRRAARAGATNVQRLA
jgi:predicted nucleic-acid-binding protein